MPQVVQLDQMGKRVGFTIFCIKMLFSNIKVILVILTSYPGTLNFSIYLYLINLFLDDTYIIGVKQKLFYNRETINKGYM